MLFCNDASPNAAMSPAICLMCSGTDPDIQLGGQFNMFPSISRLFLHWRGQVYSQSGWGHARICSTWICNLSVLHCLPCQQRILFQIISLIWCSLLFKLETKVVLKHMRNFFLFLLN